MLQKIEKDLFAVTVGSSIPKPIINMINLNMPISLLKEAKERRHNDIDIFYLNSHNVATAAEIAAL